MDREKNFWGRIVEGIWSVRSVLDRIENAVLSGMPDTYYTIEGVSGWIELKAPLEPVRKTTALFSGNHTLSIAQRNWLRKHRQAGGLGFVGVESENWVFLVEARNADFVNSWTLADFQLHADFSAARPLGKADWTMFARTLQRRALGGGG